MPYHFRAAALAAAVLGFSSAAGVSAPSIASEREAAPTISFTAHAETTLTVESLGLNELQDPAPEAPVSRAAPHEVAPALPRTTPVTRSLAQLVAELAATTAPDAETDCLARGVYYESKGEPLAGQLTVAEVIINRARSGRFASTICGVLRQRGQFSFVRGGHIPTPPAASRDWRTAVAIARIATDQLAEGAAPRALFFHARHVRPGWRLTRVATVGNHIFYR